jgi:hypothetical protein
MEIPMSNDKQILMQMSTSELRAYVLQHREDEEALHLYLDKVNSERSNSTVYSPEENVGDAIDRYLETHK